MRTIGICDDDQEQLAAAVGCIRQFADESGLDVSIVEFENVEACVRDAASLDLVFMDIEFNDDPLGIDAARRINEVAPNCQVVYLTNYLHYSLDVYQTDHVWYVLKSQLEERLGELFHKVALIDAARHASIVITTKDDAQIVNVPCDSIRFLERRGRITSVVTLGITYAVREKLPELLERLPADTFARCHNSYAIYLPRVAEVHANNLVMDDGTQVPVSRGYSKRFRKRYLLWADAWSA